jgi:predicted dehydrogenase
MRIALTGVGHWHAPMHLDAIRAAGAEPAGAWDPDPAVAVAFAAANGLAAAPSLGALLAGRPDLVIAMGHPSDVSATARAILAAGLPMVLEKPAASRSDELAAIAPAPGAFVAVPLANRCSPLWAELDRLRAAGRLGAIGHAHFRIINGPPERYRVDRVPWLLDPAIAGGGALRNLGLHAVDAALQIFGAAEPALLAATVRSDLHGEAVDDYALATLALPHGPVVTVETGYTYASMLPGGDYEWRVAAAGATLIDRGTSLRVTTLDDGATRDLAPLPSGQRYRAFLADTLACLRAGRRPLVDFADYLRAMRLVDAIYTRAAA